MARSVVISTVTVCGDQVEAVGTVDGVAALAVASAAYLAKLASDQARAQDLANRMCANTPMTATGLPSLPWSGSV